MKVCTRFGKDPRYEIGGAERQMLLLGKELTKMGINFHYITHQHNSEIISTNFFKGVKIKSYGFKFKGIPHSLKDVILNFISSTDLELFLKYYHELDYDIYHLRGASLLTGIWCFFAKYIKQKRFIFTIAGLRDCKKDFYPWSKSTYSIYYYGLKNADLVISPAKYIQKKLINNFGIRSLVIKSGHPIPQTPFKKDDPPMILWISRLRKVKRPNLFLKIADSLKDLNVKFVLIGSGKYLREEIESYSQENINFEYIPGVTVGKDNIYYEKASLLVNTSSYEGFPNAFIQAWMHKTPVLSLDVDPDNVINENNLGLCSNGDLNVLNKKIREIIQNPTELKNLGKNCRDYAINNHDIKKIARKYYYIYKRFIKNSK